jgi:hypothetical protein
MTLGGLRFPRRSAAPSTLKHRLVTLTLAVLVPAFLIAGLLLWSVEANARRALYARLQETARALSLVVDRQFGEQTVLLETLAASSEMQRGDWAALDRHARQVLGARIAGSRSWMGPAGTW